MTDARAAQTLQETAFLASDPPVDVSQTIFETAFATQQPVSASQLVSEVAFATAQPMRAAQVFMEVVWQRKVLASQVMLEVVFGFTTSFVYWDGKRADGTVVAPRFSG